MVYNSLFPINCFGSLCIIYNKFTYINRASLKMFFFPKNTVVFVLYLIL